MVTLTTEPPQDNNLQALLAGIEKLDDNNASACKRSITVVSGGSVPDRAPDNPPGKNELKYGLLRRDFAVFLVEKYNDNSAAVVLNEMIEAFSTQDSRFQDYYKLDQKKLEEILQPVLEIARSLNLEMPQLDTAFSAGMLSTDLGGSRAISWLAPLDQSTVLEVYADFYYSTEADSLRASGITEERQFLAVLNCIRRSHGSEEIPAEMLGI